MKTNLDTKVRVGIDGSMKTNLDTKTDIPAVVDAVATQTNGKRSTAPQQIELNPGREDETTNKALKALSCAPSVYVMGGRLVRVGKVDSENDPFHRSQGTLQPVPMTEPVIRAALAGQARFYRREKQGESFSDVQKSCPSDIIRAVATDGFWNGFRHLAGTTPVPVMRADGTVLDQPGYDRSTRLILEPNADVPHVKDRPTQADAIDAADMLADVFADFPFEDHQKGIAGCVAAILTLVSRPMIEGPCPLFLVDGNRAGSGKTKIVDACGLIAGLRSMPRKSIPQDDAEFRKTITGVASAGLPAMLVDNIARPLGGDSLDAVLTSDVWQDRLLGSNEIQSFPMRTVWFGTGNNVVLKGDTYRRVLRIPLDCRIENPETRSDFRHPNLLKHVRENRTQLLGAGLTMLRAWHVADRPDGGLDTWGSFEAFSRVVRGTLAFSGMADPAPAADRMELATKSDMRRAAIPVLLSAWPTENGEPMELKSSEIAKRAEDAGDLKDAIEQLLPSAKSQITNRTVGCALRDICGHVANGRRLTERESRNKSKLWTIEAVTQ